MRIGLDGYNLAIPNGTGVATYGHTLARMLQELGHQVDGLFGLDAGRRAEMRELLFFERFGLGDRRTARAAQRRIAGIAASAVLDWTPRRPVSVPLSDRVDRRAFTYRLPAFDTLWNSANLFDVAYARFRHFGRFLTVSMPDPPDVMHWTYPLPIRMAGAKNVYTLHDLVPLRLPHTTLDEKPYYYRLIRECIASADHLCTVSDSSLADVIRYFPEADGKITNTYQSSPVPEEVLSSNPADDAAIIKGMFGLDNKAYFLFFGAADPKKNLGRIVDAYLTANVRTPLVIVSGRDWGMNEETRMLGSGGQVYGRAMGKRIVRLEYLPRATLFRLIRTAKAVLFPSLLEGFGLPALEAIQLGTPVVSSNVSSLPEVVGDAGLLVDPYKVQDIAAAIRAIDSDAEVAARLRAEGPGQSAKFSDAAYRQRLADFYARFTPRD
jgi:glycosyltransferase involved in cell wall biosynthesis